MPDANGLLTQPERDHIASVMQRTLKPTACPWCGETRWEVGMAIVVEPPLLPDGRLYLLGAVIPMVTLISPCGHVAHFAAKKFGLQVQPTEAPTPPPPMG
ncbi:MAG TPA: hypothetical protein VGB91_01100 [Rhizomicrobium sp.]